MLRSGYLAAVRWALFLAASALAIPALAEPTFPYTAFANADNVQVRSGPGENYYPTDALPRGAAVEVYRHDPGGWYAVRPPEGSFSWVQAQDVQPWDDRVVVVESPRAVARVGSQLSDIRDVIQLRLEQGEHLQVLGAKTFGEQTWYKIAPPSGEFRWVYGRFLDPQPAGTADANSAPPRRVAGPEHATRAGAAAGNDPSEVELAGLWPKRNAQSNSEAQPQSQSPGLGFWKKRTAAEQPQADEMAARQPDRWWQRGDPRQSSRAAPRQPSRNRRDEMYDEPSYDEEPYFEGPNGEPVYSDEPYVVYEDGPPEDLVEDGRHYRGSSVYERSDGNTARARLSPHLRELADNEARDGDAEEPYPGAEPYPDGIVERDEPRRGGRSYDRRGARYEDRYDNRYEPDIRPREYERDYSVRDRRRDDRGGRRRDEDYALDDRRSGSQRGSFKVHLPSRGSYGGEPGALSGDIDWLDMELSTLVVEEAPPVDYDDLRERAEDLLAKAATPLERGQARLMMEKIDRFAELTDRNVSLARRLHDRKPTTRTARRSAPDLNDGAMTGDSALRAKAGRYDGVGKLTAVVSERAGSPAYALLDERGKVQCYVTPAPGVNLRHYVGQEVGLNGSVGFNAELSRRQVVAQRITPLDDGPVRR